MFNTSFCSLDLSLLYASSALTNSGCCTFITLVPVLGVWYFNRAALRWSLSSINLPRSTEGILSQASWKLLISSLIGTATSFIESSKSSNKLFISLCLLIFNFVVSKSGPGPYSIILLPLDDGWIPFLITESCPKLWGILSI